MSLAAMIDQQTKLDEEMERLQRQRESLQAQIECERNEQQSAPSAKRARSESACTPHKWVQCSEVQADVVVRRAAGQILPFGAPGRKPRVYVDGCFDMMHSGHFNAVRQAKLLAEQVGGTLVVGVHSDAEILLNKGPAVMNNEERLAVVTAVKWVDQLIFDTPYSATLPFLDSIDADFCVHGDDISINADGTDAYAEAKAVGRIKIVKRTEGVSTTDIVGRLLLLTRSPHTLTAEANPSSVSCCVSASTPAIIESGYVGANVSSTGVSQFLPTTWRLRQFSSGRAPLKGAASPKPKLCFAVQPCRHACGASSHHRPHMSSIAGDRVIYIDGAFDILHAGHIGALFAARRKGDFLMVGLHDDATVNKVHALLPPTFEYSSSAQHL